MKKTTLIQSYNAYKSVVRTKLEKHDVPARIMSYEEFSNAITTNKALAKATGKHYQGNMRVARKFANDDIRYGERYLSYALQVGKFGYGTEPLELEQFRNAFNINMQIYPKKKEIDRIIELAEQHVFSEASVKQAESWAKAMEHLGIENIPSINDMRAKGMPSTLSAAIDKLRADNPSKHGRDLSKFIGQEIYGSE